MMSWNGMICIVSCVQKIEVYHQVGRWLMMMRMMSMNLVVVVGMRKHHLTGRRFLLSRLNLLS